MTDKLLTELTEAREIIADAYEHYDRADQLEACSLAEKKKTRRRMIIGIIAWCIGSVFLPDNIFIITPLLNIAYFGCLIALIFYIRNNSKTGDYLAQRDEEKQTGDHILESNEDKMAFLRQDYRFPRTIDYLVEIVKTGRADDLNSALAMCDEQIHRWNLEEANEALYEEMTRQSKQLAGIESNTAIGAAANIMNIFSRS